MKNQAFRSLIFVAALELAAFEQDLVAAHPDQVTRPGHSASRTQKLKFHGLSPLEHLMLD